MKKIRALLLIFLCLAIPLAAEVPRITASLGQQTRTGDPEVALRYIGTPYFWKLQPVLGVSVASNGLAWMGAGPAVTWRPARTGAFVRISSMVGLYRKGSGKDLGGPLEFRSALDLGIVRPNGGAYGIGADHRSNAGIYKVNPGLNTIYMFLSLPLR